jgi:serine/threonine-protein kinase
MDVFPHEKGVYAFAGFVLDPVRRTLSRDGTPVKLTPRLFDMLAFFVQNPDQILTKEQLLDAVWGGRLVEDGNLSQTIFSLRRALKIDGEDSSLIVTVPGRGYRFAAGVRLETDAPPALAPPGPAPPGPAALRRSGIAGRILLALLVLGGVAFGLVQALVPRPAASFTPPPHSIAVLAFANMTGDPAQSYFSDGLAEELIGSLSRVAALQVAARTSSFSFKGSHAVITDIARQLNVGAVLEGSVRREGADWHVTVQLIDGVSGYQLWSNSYDPGPSGMLALQQGIAQAVTTSLQVTLLGNDARKFTLGGTENTRAFEAYLRGIRANQQMTEAGYRAAQADFDAALALDPKFALAYVGRAWALNWIAGIGTNPDPGFVQKTMHAADDDADHAIALAPNLAVAHRAKAYLLQNQLDFAAAETEIAQAHALAPGDAQSEISYGVLEVMMGHPQAGVAAVRHAAELDPLTPLPRRNLADVLFWSRQYSEALAVFANLSAHGTAESTSDADMIGEILLMQGKPAEAVRHCAGEQGWFQNECLAIAYHALGRPDLASSQLTKLQHAMGNDAAYNYAEIFAQWGARDTALRWLQLAYNVRDPGLAELKVDPLLDPLRTEPGFQAILRKLNFPS